MRATQQVNTASGAAEKDQEVADAQEQGGIDQEVPDTTKQANLQKQVKASLDAAKQIALQHQSVTVTAAQLENEDGNAVYNVAIKDSNGQAWEVKVDGKTGTD